MSYPKDFPNYLKLWINYDNYLKEINKKIKVIKEKKEVAEIKLTELMENHDLTNTKINVGNSNIMYSEIFTTNSLSYKFILECLGEYFNDYKKAEEICEFIKSERDKTKKVHYSIKRQFNKS